MFDFENRLKKGPSSVELLSETEARFFFSPITGNIFENASGVAKSSGFQKFCPASKNT
jgi:hypothetical protein